MVKVTFTLDDATVATLKRTAARVRKPQSWVVREAVAEYGAKASQLTLDEQKRLLDVVQWAKSLPVTGTQEDADREIAEIRRSRRLSSARRTPK
ncbi:MAG: ribbon-helix-helix protein, CopG family [Vicinamibacterales bacterium]